MWAMSLNLRIKLRRGDFGGGRSHFLGFSRKRGRESRERSSNFYLRSTELGHSVFVEPRTKVHLCDENYTWVPETKDFAEDSSKEFREIMGFGSPGLPKALSSLQEVGILSIMVYFPF